MLLGSFWRPFIVIARRVSGSNFGFGSALDRRAFTQLEFGILQSFHHMLPISQRLQQSITTPSPPAHRVALETHH
jgi:hypothetical protein